MKPLKSSLPTTLLLGALAAPVSWSQHTEHAATGMPPSPEQLGKVEFALTCTPAAHDEFNYGMALLHSLWFEPARQSFVRVLEHDPQCGMAYWGIALMSMGNPFTWPPGAKALDAAADAMASAERVSASSERERDYISALATYFADTASRDHRNRAMALERAMQAVAEKHSDDVEAQILYALVLNMTAVPTDKTFANQRKAAAILEPLFARYPDHPGVAHYLVHTYDYTELAQSGLPAAKAYAKIAPAVPHARHMPSHIFSRLGLWREMIDSNLASYEAAKAELGQSTFDVGTYDALHAMDYLVFAYLQQARDKAAQRVADEAAAIRKVNVENFVAAYAFAAIPSRFALERGNWRQAAELRLSPPDLAWDRFPQAESIHVFARGLGAARSGDVAAARKHVARLETLKRALTKANVTYWAGQTDFQITIVSAWIALAEQRSDEALALMRRAADAEDASDKHPVTPGNVAPSRELLADMLMELGKPALALAEYEQSLTRDPNRLRGVYGAARAAELAGNERVARDRYAQLVALTADRDTDRPELLHSKGYLARK